MQRTAIKTRQHRKVLWQMWLSFT